MIAQWQQAQHNECVAVSITVRDVPEAARDELAARAARGGRSLQEFLRLHLVDLALRPDPEAVYATIRERKARTASTLSAAAILDHRAADAR
jgi:plasmid stability protein